MTASPHEEHEHGHAHSHGHHHHGVQSRHALLFAVALTLGFALVEAATGWWSGSLALLGDAGHMVTDATALGMAALAAWFSRRPPSARHSYGFARAEVMAALLNALFMVAVVAAISVAAVQRFYAAQPINGVAVTVVAALGLAINVAMALVLSRGEKTLNTRGALLHVMGDLLGSVAALIAGVVVSYTGWTPIDPILSLFICALILFSSLGLLREALHTLMEGVPLGLSLPAVGNAMSSIAGVSSVHDLHIWDSGRGARGAFGSRGDRGYGLLGGRTVAADGNAQSPLSHRACHTATGAFEPNHPVCRARQQKLTSSGC